MSVPTRIASTSSARRLDPTVRPRKRGGLAAFLLVSLLTLGLAVMWTVIAQRQLAASIDAEAEHHLDAARRTFDSARARARAELQGSCRVLVEDPRLKSTLATEGMDAPTVADILGDLTKLRGAGFLLVLTPEGTVFAEAGAPELRGLDLADSSVVKKAQTTADAVVGSWVLGKRVMDLSLMAIRYGDDLVAFLAVGQAIDDDVMRAIADQSGVQAASALATTVVASSAPTAVSRDALAAAALVGPGPAHVLDLAGERYLARVIELGETAQAHRLVLAQPVATTSSAFEPLRWMQLAPPLLVLVTVLFSLFGLRLFRRP